MYTMLLDFAVVAGGVCAIRLWPVVLLAIGGGGVYLTLAYPEVFHLPLLVLAGGFAVLFLLGMVFWFFLSELVHDWQIRREIEPDKPKRDELAQWVESLGPRR